MGAELSTLMGTQNADAVAITGGAINGASVGATAPAAVAASTLSATGVTTPTGGLASALAGAVARTVFHSGDNGAVTTTQGTDTTPSVTTTYICEVFIEGNCTLTGISILGGSANAGNVAVALADSNGNVVASSASTGAAQTAGYQQVPFSATYAAIGPAKYFILLQNSNTSNRFRSHILGNFGASTKTGETFATFTKITAPTTFTTNVGPVADTY